MSKEIDTVKDFANTFVYYSPNESATRDGSGFWSEETKNWVDIDEASFFKKGEELAEMPLALGRDVVIMKAENAIPSSLFATIAKERAQKA